jgi:hypothetical protein
MEQGKVEIDEILRILSTSCTYYFLPCKLLNVLGVYIHQKQDNQVTKMTKLGAKYVVACPNLFIQYEQNSYKFVIFSIFYHNFIKDGMSTGRLNDYH